MHPSIVKSTRMRCRCTCNNARTFSNRCCYKCGKVDKAQSNKSVPILIGSSIRSNSSKSVEEPVLFEKGKCEKSIAATTHEPHHHDIESIDISNLGINTQTTSNHAHNHTHKNGNKLEGELYAHGKDRSRQHSEPNSIVTSASSNVHRYQRRWSSSSSFYMWKKKSTLKESSTTDGNSGRKEAVVVRNIVNELDENISERTADELSVTRELLPHSTTDSDNGTPFPLLQLPNELIFMILTNLHVRDLKTCKTVCRRLYHIVNETVKGLGVTLTGNVSYHTLMNCCESRPSSLTLHKCWLDSQLSVMDIVNMINTIGDHLKKLTIGTSNFSSIAGTDAVLHLFVTYCQNITSLKLEWITVSGVTLKNAIKKLKQLQSLYLIDVNGISSHDWLGILMSLHHQGKDCKLQSLCVKLQPELPLSMVLSTTYPIYSLRSITCRQRMTKVTKGKLVSLLSGCPNIKEVDIDCIEISNEATDLLAKSALKHNFRTCRTNN